jgi:hypothetical protein
MWPRLTAWDDNGKTSTIREMQWDNITVDGRVGLLQDIGDTLREVFEPFPILLWLALIVNANEETSRPSYRRGVCKSDYRLKPAAFIVSRFTLDEVVFSTPKPENQGFLC